MDTQTERIIAGLFDIIVAELPDDIKERICKSLDYVGASPLIREADKPFYRIVRDSISRPIGEIADQIIAETPSRERSSRLHRLHVVSDNAALEGDDAGDAA
jgi:hypothetical protein